MHRASLAATASLLLALAGADVAGAQQLRGRLLDVESDAPIPLGVVTLLGTDLSPVAASITDSLGNWRLVVPGPGSYYVAARRIGYQPWTAGPLEMKVGDDLEFRYHLRRAPARLTPAFTVGRSMQRNLEMVGFYERQRADFGLFLSPEAIEKRGAVRISDLLIGLPGVSYVWTSSGSVGGQQLQLRAGNISPGGSCRPRIYVDGIVFARGDARRVTNDNPATQTTEQAVEEEMRQLEKGLSLDDIGPASDIAAIEVYRSPIQVPVQFGGASIETACGVIVIWTRRGTPRGKG